MPHPSPLSLGKRERQIVETLYRLGEASVAQVRTELPNAPSYSAVRAMLNILLDKRLVTARQDGKRYVYSPVMPKDAVRRSALRNLVRTFFGSAPLEAVAALVDGSAGALSVDDLRRLRQLIDEAETEQQTQTSKPRPRSDTSSSAG